MALITCVPIRAGDYFCSYWKIGSVLIDYRHNQVGIWLHGWTDPAARQLNDLPQGSLHIAVSPNEIGNLSIHNMTTENAYRLVKSTAERDGELLKQNLEYSGPILNISAFSGGVDY